MKLHGLFRAALCAFTLFGTLGRGDNKTDDEQGYRARGLTRKTPDYKDMLEIMKDRNCFNPHATEEGEEFYGCMPKTRLGKDNTRCKPNPEAKCRAYCEAYTYWDYGKEVPFEGSFCEKGACTLSRGLSAAIIPEPWTHSLEAKFFSPKTYFNFQDPNMTAVSVLRDKPEEFKDECGYWAFIPFRVHSCGITSIGRKWRVWFITWCTDTVQTSECASTIWQTQKKEAGGEVIFVATDCANPVKRRPFCKQNPIYLKKGVSIDPQVHEDYLRALKDRDPSKGVVREHLEACQQDK